MGSSVYLSSAVVILACVGFMVVGTVYKWDVTSSGYARWTRAIGALALVAIALVLVWDRFDDLRVVAAATFLGVVLASAYVWMHRRVTERVSRDMGSAGQSH